MKEFFVRLSTTVVLVLIALATILYLDHALFSALIFLISSAACWELAKLSEVKLPLFIVALLNGALLYLPQFLKVQLDLVLALALALNSLFILLYVRSSEKLKSFGRDFGFLFIALLYLYFPLSYMVSIREYFSARHLFFLIFIIAIGDSFAYFVGVRFGKHKIYPVASPKKSLEGLIGALVSAAAFAWPGLKLFGIRPEPSLAALIATALLVELFSQVADPVESLFKRASGKKDSSNILPGHGGILDRVDSYLLCAPLFFYLVGFFW